MARISVSPFLTVPAGPETVMFPRAPEITGLPWETGATLVVGGDVLIDAALCRLVAGLPANALLHAQLEVWCDATYWSESHQLPVPGEAGAVHLEVTVPPGSVYGALRHRRTLLLGETLQHGCDEVAYEKGSILTLGQTESVPLSGDGGQFPTSMKDFGAAGLPRDARWYLSMRHDSPDDPVLGTVTLWLNENSPAVQVLRGTAAAHPDVVRLTGRILRRYVVEQLLRAAVDEAMVDASDWPEHSVGALLVDTVSRFAGGMTGTEFRTTYSTDRERFELLVDAAVPDVL